MRVRLSRALYAAALTVGLLILLGSLTGGFTVPGLSFTSFRGLRIAAGLFAAGWLLDPMRTVHSAWVAEILSQHGRRLATASIIACSSWWVSWKVTQHASFHTGAYDLELYDSAIRNTLNGQTLLTWGLGRHFFSEHFSPALLGLVPGYALWPGPMFLMTVEGLAVGLSVWPLFLYARRRGLRTGWSLLITAVWVAHPSFWRAVEFDFHVELLAPVFLFTAAWAMSRHRWAVYYLSLFAALCTKEDVVLVTAAVGVLLWQAERAQWKHALTTLALSVLWGAVAFHFVIPAYREPGSLNEFLGRFGPRGDTLFSIALSFMLHPLETLRLLGSEPMLRLVGGTGGLALFNPLAVLVSLPSLLLHLGANYEYESGLNGYYGLNGLLVLVLGLPRGVQFARKWLGTLPAALALLAIVSFPPIFRSRFDDTDALWPKVLAQLPPDAVVEAQTVVIPHLPPTFGKKLFTGTPEAPWVVLRTDRFTWPLQPAEYEARVEALRHDPRYRLVREELSWLVFTRVE